MVPVAPGLSCPRASQWTVCTRLCSLTSVLYQSLLSFSAMPPGPLQGAYLFSLYLPCPLLSGRSLVLSLKHVHVRTCSSS